MSTSEKPAAEAAALSSHSPISPRAPGSDPLHFAFVDALRGLAFLAVVMVHLSPLVSGGPIRRVGYKGAFGVQLFFVVSAFTLFWSLRSRETVDRKPIAAYFVRRFFRIAPLFWFAILFYAYHPGFFTTSFSPGSVGATQILTTIFFVHGWSPRTFNAMVPGGWTIATEVTFYLLVPILFRWVQSLTAALWLSFASTIVASFFEPMLTTHLCRLHPASWNYLLTFFVNSLFPFQFPVFCLGIVLYFILVDHVTARQELHTSARWPRNRQLAVLLALLAPALLLSPGIPEEVNWAIAFVALAIALAIQPFRIIVNPVTRFLGTISFSAYIWHFWVLEKTAALTGSLLAFNSLSRSARGTVQFVILYPVTVLLTAAISVFSYHLIEVPGRGIGSAIIGRYGWGGSDFRLRAQSARRNRQAKAL